MQMIVYNYTEIKMLGSHVIYVISLAVQEPRNNVCETFAIHETMVLILMHMHMQLQVQPRDVSIHCSATFDGGRNARLVDLKCSAMTVRHFYASLSLSFSVDSYLCRCREMLPK